MPEQPGSQQVRLPFAMHDQIWKVSYLSARGPPGRTGEDGKVCGARKGRWRTEGGRGLSSTEDKKDKGGGAAGVVLILFAMGHHWTAERAGFLR